jgi:signal transduction histidine kinase
MNDSLSSNHQPIPDYPRHDLIRDLINAENLSYIQAILNSNAHISAIVNRHKQIVLSNEHLVNIAGISLSRIIGERPGEILNCIHTADGSACTSTVNCQFCGINRTIHESQVLNKRISSDCRITTLIHDRRISYDFKVTCTPFTLRDEQYTLLNLLDISSEKRNEMLERVFFHDILNRLGGLSGIVQILKTENKQAELEEFIDLLETIGELTVEDIQTQRFLKAAENANLILNIRDYSAFDIVESVRKQMSFHPALKSKKFIICSECIDFTFKTDGALLKRILLNMITNAAEATLDQGTISIVCSKKPGLAVFSVQNAGIIPEDLQLQIFQRSFSTKGYGRGLGTYSMKLFGENYLKGRVYFISDEKEGTVFTIELPIEQ